MPNPTEQPTPTPESLGRIKAAVQGMTGVFSQLFSDHREATLLLETLAATTELEHRRALWRETTAALIAHERAEQQELYEVFRAYPALQTIVDEHTHQTHLLEALIAELDALPMASADWHLSLQRLEATVKQHIEEEETYFFPRAQAAIGKDRAELLELPYVSARRSLQTALRLDGARA